MRSRTIELALWSLTLLALGVTGALWRRALSPHVAAAATVWPVPPVSPIPSVDSLTILTSRIVDRDAFRLDRKPAAVAYRTSGDSAVSAAPPSPPKPVLSLVGIVGGPPWAALVNGIPAHDGSVLVHARDTAGGLRVTRVSADGVTISGLDTVWHLTTKQN
ncbi:MAG TPA: hypothetical protein VFW04_12400 [Gemmatimonadaceae bacterium]|nr:hypothetical protein [Gemmatimonadaceae bacterium]